MHEAMAFAGLGPGELVLIAAVVLLLFGAKRIPELMRSVGSGFRQFKRGVEEGLPEEEVEPWKSRKSA
jgi:sec-independent protein translocase protein TatA